MDYSQLYNGKLPGGVWKKCMVSKLTMYPIPAVTAEVEGLAQGAFLPCTALGEHWGQQLRKGSHLLDQAKNRIALLFQKKFGRDLNLTLGSFRRAA